MKYEFHSATFWAVPRIARNCVKPKRWEELTEGMASREDLVLPEELAVQAPAMRELPGWAHSCRARGRIDACPSNP